MWAWLWQQPRPKHSAESERGEQRLSWTTEASEAYAEITAQHLRALAPSSGAWWACSQGFLSLGDGAELPGHG